MENVSRKNLTDLPFLNIVETSYDHKGSKGKWLHAERTGHKDDKPDAVIVIAYTIDGKIILIRQMRVPAGGYVIELPAGLVDEGESIEECAKREFKEETGMDLDKIFMASPPVFSSVGMTNETVSIVIGVASGTPSTRGNTESEDIEILVLDEGQVWKLMNDNKTKFCSRTWLYLMTEGKYGRKIRDENSNRQNCSMD